MYDCNPDYMGATIHLLTKGLDSGPMLFHAFPKAEKVDPFVITMKSVIAAQQGFIEYLKDGTLHNLASIPQDKTKEIRYTRSADFTDDVAADYLKNLPTPEEVDSMMNTRDFSQFIKPYVTK
jgi:hypothetical protein